MVSLGTFNLGYGARVQYADFDGDGDFDMVQSSNDDVFYLENQGDQSNPNFVQLGQVTTNPFWVFRAAPARYVSVVDFYHDDPYPDYIVGYSLQNNGEIAFFRNHANEWFEQMHGTDNPLSSIMLLDVQYSSLTIVDLDSDGDFDIFVGQSDGSVEYWENVGNQSHPQLFQNDTGNPFHGRLVGDCPSMEFMRENDGTMQVVVGSGTYADKTIQLWELHSNGSMVPVGSNPFANLTFNDNAACISLRKCDFDMDNDHDIFVTNFGQQTQLLRNDGAKHAHPWVLLEGRANPLYTTDPNAGFLGVACVKSVSSYPELYLARHYPQFSSFYSTNRNAEPYAFTNVADEVNPLFYGHVGGPGTSSISLIQFLTPYDLVVGMVSGELRVFQF